MSEATWSYIAGFWEGEGYAIRYKRKDKSHKNSFRLHIGITQKNPKVLYWIKNYCGYGFISCRHHLKSCYDWQAKDKSARLFLRQIYPYLKFRQDQVASLLNYYKI